MSTGSWPLDLFWILSVVIVVFAVAAYIVGESLDRRHHKLQGGTAAKRGVSPAGGIRS